MASAFASPVSSTQVDEEEEVEQQQQEEEEEEEEKQQSVAGEQSDEEENERAAREFADLLRPPSKEELKAAWDDALAEGRAALRNVTKQGAASEPIDLTQASCADKKGSLDPAGKSRDQSFYFALSILRAVMGVFVTV
jgi:hypothetical protein